MRAEIETLASEIHNSLELLAQRMDWNTAEFRLEEFNAMSEDPDLWSDPDKAQKLMRERQALVDAMKTYSGLKQDLTDNIELIELGELEEDEAVIADAEAAIKKLKAVSAQKELEALLNGEADSNDTFLEINAGAGGTESCDWASMLARMYVRWAEKAGYSVEVQSEQSGEEAGLKSVSYKISGHNAYGWLKSESGVHRLVRISPFDSAAKRHTSFTSVKVYPVVDDSIEIEVNASDIRIDTYRSSGAGGQHVNKTDSAVRITHIPTGTVVQCQNERSQHKNKATAMKVLRAQLFELSRREQEAKMAEITGEKREIGFGSQIRSYTLHPQQRVKDHRTDLEVGNVEGVLDGDLDRLIRSALLHQSGGSRAED